MIVQKVDLWVVLMRRKRSHAPGYITVDVLIAARNTTNALQIAKEVKRGYSLVHVTPYNHDCYRAIGL